MLHAQRASSRLRSGVIGGRERGPCVPGPQMPKPGRSGSWTLPAGVRPASGAGRWPPIPHKHTAASTGTAAPNTGPSRKRLRSAPQGPHQADTRGDRKQAHPPGEWRSRVRHVPGPGGLRWDAPGRNDRSGGWGHRPGGRPDGPRCGRNRGRRAGRGGDGRRTGGRAAGPRSGRRGGGDRDARRRCMVARACHQQDDTEDQEHGDDRRHRKEGLGRGPAPSCHASLVSVE
jgi:translation initiation factor IF-2